MISGSETVFSEVDEAEGAELCDDRPSTEKTEDEDEEAEEAIEEVYG